MEERIKFLALIGLATVGFGARAAEILTVCPRCPIRTIHQAISLAPAGATIRILSALYHESDLEIQKPVTLEGEGWPVIDIGSKGNGFLVHADAVTITGLELRNSGFSYLEDVAAIKVSGANHCRILRNRLDANGFAIYVGQSVDCLVEGNSITGAGRSESSMGDGIHLWNVQKAVIRGNQIKAHRDGIYFEFVRDSSIVGNRSAGNVRYGLHFMYSDRDDYRENEFSGNSAGVAVMYSRNIRMSHNRFSRSWGSAAYGLLLKEISASRIDRNLFDSNTIGIYLEGTTRSLLEENRFLANGWGMRLMGDSESNLIWHNDFLSNTFDVSTNGSRTANVFNENYWSDYSGLDLNRDGIGDNPFRPVRLSSALMERLGTSVLLLKSFFFTVADEAESLLPVLTPVNLIDERPLMRPRNFGGKS